MGINALNHKMIQKTKMIPILLILCCVNVVTPQASTTNQPHACCEGKNILIKTKCFNGKPTDLNCKPKIILDRDVDEDVQFTIADDGRLLYPSSNLFEEALYLEKSEYCITKLSEESSDVAIICYDAVSPGQDDYKWFGLRAVCGLISVLFLIATLTVYFLVPTLQDLQGKCIMHNISALAVAMLLLSIVQLADMEAELCTFCAFASYFTFMTAFFWLNVTSFQIWRTVVYPNIAGTERQWYIGYLVYGYGMPFVFLCMLLLAHHFPGSHLNPKIGVDTCWFGGMKETWAYFYGPIAILLLSNLVMFFWCISKLWIERKTITDLSTKSLKYKVRLYIGLFVIMGIMWIFEITSSIFEKAHYVLDYVWIVTDYINVLQGVLIFLLLVVLRKRALRGLASRGIGCMTFPSTWRNLEDEEEADAGVDVQVSSNGFA